MFVNSRVLDEKMILLRKLYFYSVITVEMASGEQKSEEDLISHQLEGLHISMMDETDDYV